MRGRERYVSRETLENRTRITEIERRFSQIRRIDTERKIRKIFYPGERQGKRKERKKHNYKFFLVCSSLYSVFSMKKFEQMDYDFLFLCGLCLFLCEIFFVTLCAL